MRPTPAAAAVLAATLLAPPSLASAQRCPDHWVRANTPGTATLLAVAEGNDGAFVTVGEGGTILASADGVSWNARDSGTGLTLRGVAGGSRGFVAVGDGGVILSSPDGEAWSARTSGTTGRLNAVTWTGERFVAVGAAGGEVLAGLILVSVDGRTWSDRTPAGVRPLYGVAANGAQAMAVGWTGAVAESPDGLTWFASSLGDVLQGCWFMLRPSFLYAVAGSQHRWVTVGLVVGDQYPGSGVSLARHGGAGWSCSVTELPPLQFKFRGVAATTSSYIAAGLGGIAESRDGLTWEPQWVAASPHLYGIAVGRLRSVAVGDHGCILVRDCPARRPVRRVVRPGSR